MQDPAPGALPESGYLWLWPGQALYSGPSLNLARHSGSVSCFAVGRSEPFEIVGRGHHRSVLIPARTPHQLISTGPMVFCYFDPASAREQACASAMTPTGHRHEHELTTADLSTDEQATAWLDLASPSAQSTKDQRVTRAAHALRENPRQSATALAATVGLSTSRFLHLFRDHTGTSFRRYRMWARMLRAGTLLSEQGDLTTAAVEAGFASPSHFSDSFRAMFGLTPSRLLGQRLKIRTFAEASSRGHGRTPSPISAQVARA